MQFDLLDEEFNNILSSNSYPEFSERLKNSRCKRCPLSAKRRNIVVDRGNPGSRIMIISERPGENEDIKGEAFVGRAGELLDKIFAAIKLDTNKDILITNVVKCLPPTERAPQSHEVEACKPFLEKQIELVRPKVIILLGAVALKYVCPEVSDSSMEEGAGKFFTLPDYPGIQFIVLYHPAFLLRDPRKKKDMWEHIKILRGFLVKEELIKNSGQI